MRLLTLLAAVIAVLLLALVVAVAPLGIAAWQGATVPAASTVVPSPSPSPTLGGVCRAFFGVGENVDPSFDGPPDVRGWYEELPPIDLTDSVGTQRCMPGYVYDGSP